MMNDRGKARIGAIAIATTVLLCQSASAINPFGFTFDMSQSAVENAAKNIDMGALERRGPDFMFSREDSHKSSYMFDFCEGKLYAVSHLVPRNFGQMAGFVDDAILAYGQPVMVKVPKREGISLTWKVNDTTFVRLTEMPDVYGIDYRKENPCVKFSP